MTTLQAKGDCAVTPFLLRPATIRFDLHHAER